MLRIPWRVKNLVSVHFPLLYHLLVNRGRVSQDRDYWDNAFRVSLESGSRVWPTKNRLIKSLTHKSDRILDVGCGTGSILRSLKNDGYTNLHGVELSGLAVETLRREGIEMTQGCLPTIPLPDESFDVVVASQVLEHIIRRRTFLREMTRVVRPGGKLFIFVPDNCLGPIDEPSHVIVYTRARLRKFLSLYLDDVEVESIRDENFAVPVLFGRGARKTQS